MSTARETVRRDWRIPDARWGRMVPLLPPRQPLLVAHDEIGHHARVAVLRQHQRDFIVDG